MAWKTRVLGTEPEEGYYRVRLTKAAPWLPCRIMRENGLWFALVAGEVQTGSGVTDPFEIPFLLRRWPLHPIEEAEYLDLMREHESAPSGHPLRQPGERVDLRNTPAASLYPGKEKRRD